VTARPLPADLPPLTLRGLRDEIYSAPRACEAEPDLFFGPDEETPAEHSARVDAARDLCADCPARLACLAYALRTRPTYGVWGGHDAEAGELSYLEAAARRPFRNPPRPPAETAA
jgi:hypothetical protein